MTTENNEKLVITLLEEYRLTFDLYTEAIQTIPENQWTTGENQYLTPARLILHATEAADYYTIDTPTGHIWKKHFAMEPDSGEIPTEDLPSKQKMLEYHKVVWDKIQNWLKDQTLETIMKPEEKYPWTGTTLLGRIIYLLAHHRQHFGELNAELRRRDLPRIKWRTLRSYQ